MPDQTTTTDAPAFVPARRTGRCASGAERDGGTVVHLITAEAAGRADASGAWSPALCGAQPGIRGNGWATARHEAATCPRCLRAASR